MNVHASDSEGTVVIVDDSSDPEASETDEYEAEEDNRVRAHHVCDDHIKLQVMVDGELKWYFEQWVPDHDFIMYMHRTQVSRRMMFENAGKTYRLPLPYCSGCDKVFKTDVAGDLEYMRCGCSIWHRKFCPPCYDTFTGTCSTCNEQYRPIV